MPKIRITLDGSEQVIAQLNALGQAGANAVTKIQSAAAKGVGFEDVGRTSQAAAAGFAAAGRGAEQAAAGFAVGRRELVGLTKALKEVQLGAISSQFAPLIGIGARLGAITAGVTALVAAFTGGTAALFKFAESAGETSKALDELARSTNTSFESLSSLQNVFARGGTPLKQFAQEFGSLSDKIQEARQQLAAEQAGPEAAQLANKLDSMVLKFQNLADGIPQTFDPLTTLDTKLKAVIKTLAQPLSFGAFGLPIKAATDQAEADLQKLADIFHNLSSDMERAQLGKALGLSPQTIATLSLGSEAIRRMQADVRELGLSLDGLDRQNLSGLTARMTETGALWDALKDKMGALASPAFTTFFQGLADGIKQLTPEFSALAAEFGKLDFSGVGKGIAQVVADLAQMAVEVGKIFEALGSGDTSKLETAFENLGNAIGGLAAPLTAAFEKAGTAAGTAFVTALVTIIQSKLSAAFSGGGGGGGGIPSLPRFLLQKLQQQIEQLINTIGPSLITPAGAAPAGGADFGPMIAAAEAGAAKIEQIFASIQVDFSGLINGAQEAVNQVSELFFTMVQSLTGLASEIATAFAGIDISSALSGQIDALIARFSELEAAARRAAAAASGGGGGGDSGVPMASGGLMGGRGTGTSDSNLARLSRGEYVVPARAVRQPGILALLEALRRTGGNLRSVLDDMGHFARGGLVLPVPAFAAGGLNTGGSSSRVLHLSIEGRSFDNLSIPESTALALERFAVHSQIASTGKKPSWRR